MESQRVFTDRLTFLFAAIIVVIIFAVRSRRSGKVIVIILY